MTEVARFILGMAASVAAVPPVLIAYLTPRYVPSEDLVRLAEDPGTAEGPGRALERRLRRCTGGLDTSPLRASEGRFFLRSWENDAGLLATTSISCTAGRCDVRATALIERRGMKVFGCAGNGRIYH